MAGLVLPFRSLDLSPQVLPSSLEAVMIASSVEYSVAPTAPTGLLATALSFTEIQLDWTDNSSNEDGFEIHNSSDGITYALLDTVGASVTTFTDTGLANNALWYYKVRSYKGAAYSDFTTFASETTWGAPTVMAATPISASRIDLTWQDNSPTEDSFKVEQSTDQLNWSVINTTAPNAESYSVTSGLTEGTLYYFRVRGVEGAGYSGYSNTASATTLAAAPSGLACSVPAALSGQTEIDLTWTDNSHAETGFQIDVSTDGGSNWSLLTSPAAEAESYNHTGLTPNTQYYYRIRAAQSGQYSAYSASANATTRKTILQLTGSLSYGYAGLPLVVGQVNLASGDADFAGCAYGYAGLPFVTWTNCN